MPWITREDPEGTYCCWLPPVELHRANAEYHATHDLRIPGEVTLVAKRDGNDDLERVKHYAALKFGTPAKYPNLQPEPSDEDRRHLDTDDYWTQNAYKRYTALQQKAATIKNSRTLSADKIAEKLQTLREEWMEVKYETHISFDEIEGLSELVGRDGEMRLNRDEAEVSYCHRDPSDWQVRGEFLPDHIQAIRDDYALAMDEMFANLLHEAADELDQPEDVDEVQELAVEMWDGLVSEDVQDEINHRLMVDKRERVHQLWIRLFSDYGADVEFARMTLRWDTPDGRYARGADATLTVSEQQFVDRMIHEAGDEMLGLDKALNSLRFRLIKASEKRKRIAEFDVYRRKAA